MNVGVVLEEPAVKPVPHSRTPERHRKGQWGGVISLLAVTQCKASLPETAVSPPLPPQSLGSCKEEKG